MRTLQTNLTIAELDAHEVVGFRLEHRLGSAARARVEFSLTDYVPPEALLGQGALLAFGHGDLEQQLAGVIAAATSIATTQVGSEGIWKMRVELVSPLALLEHSVTSRIFQEMSVPDIIKAVLAEHGVPDSQQKWKLGGSYEPRIYCVQYGESALAFVSRLMEKEGIFVSTRAGQDAPTLIFEDDSAGCVAIAGDARLRYIAAAALRHEEDAVLAIRDRHRTTVGSVAVRDVDFTRPSLDLTAKAEADLDADLEIYDYPGGYTEPSVGDRYARVRLEAEQAERRTLEIESNCARLDAGKTFELADAPRSLDGRYLVTEVVHELLAPGSEGFEDSGEAPYQVHAKLVHEKVPFRAPVRTPQPVIEGPQTAVVVAPAGSEAEEIHTDEWGRCKVKFHWDLDEPRDDRASCWIRTGQMQTTGSMILPRVDWEVLVEFQHGDPDRPIVTGRVFNGRFMPPYALPEGKTRTSIQTASSPGGEGRNEIRFEDSAGNEEVSIKAQKNQSLNTGNNKDKSTGNDETQSVGGNRTLSIGANQSIKVTGGFKQTVGASQAIAIGGSRELGVNAVLGLSCAANVTSVGGSQFEMDGNPFSGLIALAIDKAKEAAKEKAKDAMKQLDAAVRDKVGQALGPVKDVMDKAEQVGKAVEAAKNGDPGAALDAASKAAGLPSPKDVVGDMAKSTGLDAGDPTGGHGGLSKADGGGQPGGHGGGGEGGGGEGGQLAKQGGGRGNQGWGSGGGDGGNGGNGGGGEGTMQRTTSGQQGRPASGGGEGGGGMPSYGDVKSGVDHLTSDDFSASQESGLDGMLNGLIDDCAKKAHDAAGTGAGGGGGASDSNEAGPAGGASANAAADSEGGPGHNIHMVGGSFLEHSAGLRALIAAGNINTNANAGMTQSIGAARVELVGGSRAEAVQGSKTESAIGLVVLSSGDEGQEIGGAMSQMIGGALLQKAGGNIQIAGGGKVGLIGALHKVDASGKITFKCGASEVVIDGSGVSFKTPLLNLAAGSIKLTKTVAEGPGGGAGGGGGAGPGKAKGGGGGAGAGGEGGAGSGGAGGGSGASTSQEDGKKKRGESADQSKDKKSATSPAGAKAKAEKAGPAVTAGTPNDGDKEMDKVRAEERKKGAKKALDSMKVNDNGVERPLTEAEKKEGMEMIDFDQPLTGEPNDGWMNFTDKNGKSGQLGDPSKTKSPKQPPRGNWYD